MNPMLTRLQEKADALRASMTSMIEVAAADGRDTFDEVETADFEKAERSLKEVDAEIARWSERALADAKAAELADKVRNATDGRFTTAIHVRSEGDTYSAENAERSYFADLIAPSSDSQASDRLKRHADDLHRATTSSAVSEFIPPAYLVNEFIPKASYSRPVSNLVPNEGTPPAQTWYYPKVTQGTAIGYQANELDTLTTQDLDASQVTMSVNTIGAYNDVPAQTLRYMQGVALDKLIFGELAKNYAVAIEQLVLKSTRTNNLGITQVNVNNVTYTDASPTVAELMVKIGEAETAIQTNTYESANVIIMHPRRWNWLRSQADTTGRPLVTPYAPSNAAATFGNAAQGIVGEFFGLPVVTSHAVQTFTDDATPSAQDRIIVANVDHLRLWESGLRTTVDTSSLSNKLGVRFVLDADVAFTALRSEKSISVVSGTGLSA